MADSATHSVKFRDPADIKPAVEPGPVVATAAGPMIPKGKKYPGPDEKATIVVGIGENGEDADVKVPDPYGDGGKWIVIKRNEPTEVYKYILGTLKGMIVERHNKDGSISKLKRAPFFIVQPE